MRQEKFAARDPTPRDSPLFFDQTLSCIIQFVQSRRTDLVFNLDEVGISEWEDRKPKNVIVPKSMGEQTVHHQVNRNLKHVSIIASVLAAGESLIPYIVTSQDSLSVREQLKKRVSVSGQT
jgi:hypothetical protein